MNLLTLALTALLAAEPGARPKIMVLDVAVGEGVDPAVARSLSGAVARVLEERHVFEVVTTAELASMLGAERQKQLLGCAEESGSCSAELTDALGTELILTGNLVRLGDAYSLTLQTTNARKARAVGRAVRIASTIPDFYLELPWAVSEATAIPVPTRPSKSRVLPLALVGVGIASLVGAGVVSLQAFLKEAEVSNELTLGAMNPSVLRPVESYRQDARAISTQKTIGLVAACAGAALVAVGAAVLIVGERGGTTTVAVGPAAAGVVVVGTF